jgi:DNA polymerase I-like protein with 3'-5' exonuclease and polymerase domains
MITTAEGLEEVLDIVGDGVAALDFEGWTIVRLAQICNDDVWAVIDFGQIGENWFGEVAHWFEDAAWVVFNSGHEKRYFAKYGAHPTCWDLANLRKAVEGGGHMSLKQLVGWELEIEMDKEEQGSDWDNGELTQSQLDYAAGDARHTWDAWCKIRARADDDHMRAFNLLDGMTDAVIEMEEAGLLLDQEYHQSLIDEWQRLHDVRVEAFREFVTEDEVKNLRSGAQLSDYFSRILPDQYLEPWPLTEKTGLLSMANKDLRMMAGVFGGTAMQEALLTLTEIKTLDKYITSFGDTLITKAKMDPEGRVRARYNIAAAITGRFSSSAPNLQQIPRDRDFFGQRLSVRKSFIAHEGEQLVSLDYSGIELRVLALLAGDEQLLYDMIHGDVHLEVGSFIAGRQLDKKITEDKEIRQSAKSVSFGIVYGISSLGLSASMKTTMDAAQGYIDFWADRYPKAFDLRNQVFEEARETQYIRVVDGGGIYMGKRPGLTKCANYPVQRAALSIMAAAIQRHKASLDEYRDRHGQVANMASTIHDALIDEAVDEHAKPVLRLMKQDMVDGYLDIFPGAPTDKLVEGGVGPSWGELVDEEV